MLRSACPLLLLFTVASGCVPVTPGGIQSRADMATNTEYDFATATDGGTDMASTMNRPWTDESRTIGPDGGAYWAAWNNGAGTIVVAGDYGTIIKSQNGTAFAIDSSVKPAFTPALVSIGGTLPGPPAEPLYVAGYGGALWRYSGDFAAGTGTWTADAPGTDENIYGVWVAPDSTAYAVGRDGVALKRSTAGTWSALTGIAAADSAFNIWGVAVGTTYSIYAVGSFGMIWYSTGGNWTAQTSGTVQALYGVWGSGPNDIYAVGDIGVILHSTGDGTWTQQNSGVVVPLEGIGGSSANEIYVVGDSQTDPPTIMPPKSTVLHKYDATTDIWDRDTLADPNDARNYYGVSATKTDVYLVGDSGAILHK